jgi:WD40 repeat protein
MSNKKGKIRIVASLEGHSGPVQSVVFHPTAHLMATAGGDNVVKLWDTDSHQCLATLVGHTAPVSCVAFHPTADVLISGSADNMLKVWHTTTHQCLSTTSLPINRNASQHGVTCIAIHPIMSFIVTGERDYGESPKLWKLSDDNTKLDFVRNINSRLGSASTRCVAVHPTEPLFATGRERTRDDSSSLLWSYEETRQGVKTNLEKEIENGRENHSKNVLSIALHPTKPFIATGSNDNTIMLWKLDNKNGKIGRSVCMAILEDHDAAVTGLAFHPTAPILVSCSADTSVIGWGFSDDMMTLDKIGQLFGNRGPVTSIAFHSNGRLLATGNQDNAALLWDSSVLTGKKQRSMALMRGLELSLVPKFFSRYMTPGQFARSDAARFMRNTLKNRGPNFLGNLEQPARAAIAALASRRAMAAARAPMRAMAMIAGPIPESSHPRSSSPKSPKPHSRTPSPKPSSPKSPKSPKSAKPHSKTPSPKSPKPHSKTPSPKSPKEDKSGGGGGTSITHRRINHSSRKIKRHSSKTKRYRRFR